MSVAQPGPIHAQERGVGFGLGAGYMWRRTDPGPGDFGGAVLSGKATASLGRVALDVHYVQGQLGAGDADATSDVVEGWVLVGVRLVPWATVQIGPHVRSFQSEGIAERWLLWEGRLALGARLVGGALTTYVDAWSVLGGDVSVTAPIDAGQGIEGGLAWRIPTTRFWGQLAYRVERVGFGAGARIETLEGLLLTIGIGRSRAVTVPEP